MPPTKSPTAIKSSKPSGGYTLGEARLHAVKGKNSMPYMAHLLMSMEPIETPSLIVQGNPTFGVDKRGRLYYNPECLAKWTLGQCSAVLLHEGLHVFLQHWKRCLKKLGDDCNDQAKLMVANIAEDCTINPMLRDAKIGLPDGGCFPERFKLPKNGSWEEYYDLLWEQAEQNKGKVPAEGDIVLPGGGSCSDGVRKEWELDDQGMGADGKPGGKDGKPGPAGLSDLEQERIIRGVCKEMQEHETRHGRGSVPGDLLRVANEILNPKVDPWRELLSAVRHAVAMTNGFGDYTYKKLARRQIEGGVRLPAHFQPKPRVLVLVDTSGSMGERDLGLALGVIRQATRHLPPECVSIAAADVEIHVVQKCMKAENVKLIGGGGTDMGAAMEAAAMLRPSPDVIVICSDGITPWPASEMRQRCVALLTQDASSSYPVPSWLKTIVLEAA